MLKLQSYPHNKKINVIKALRTLFPLDLKAAKDLAEAYPVDLAGSNPKLNFSVPHLFPERDEKQAAQLLRDAGAEVIFVDETQGDPEISVMSEIAQKMRVLPADAQRRIAVWVHARWKK